MLTVAVWEPAPLLTPILARTLPPALARLIPPDRPADLLVVFPENSVRSPLSCRTLLMPGGAGYEALSVPQAVSYGPSPRDTLTFSSLGPGGLLLSLQREVTTLAGNRLERQELPVPDMGGVSLTLAWAGALLLAGVGPEELAGFRADRDDETVLELAEF